MQLEPLVAPVAGWLVQLFGDASIAQVRGSADERAMKKAQDQAIETVVRLAPQDSQETLRVGLREVVFATPLGVPELMGVMGDDSLPIGEAVRAAIASKAGLLAHHINSNTGHPFYQHVTVTPDWVTAQVIDAYITALRHYVLAGGGLSQLMDALNSADIIARLDALSRQLSNVITPTTPSPRVIGRIPTEAECFQYREAVDLRGAFDSEKVVVLIGTNGVGKTQLAANYAYDALRTGLVDRLIWISAVSNEAVVERYAEAGVEVAGGERDNKEQAAERFLASLLDETSDQWLVVLDDVADPACVAKWSPSQDARARVLVTTNRGDAIMTGKGRSRIDVGCFSRDEASEYLTAKLAAHNRIDDPEQIAGLAEDLAYLPLALAQAAAYMVEKGLHCSSFRQRLGDRSRRLQELAPDNFPDPYSVKMAATWSLSIDAADQLDPQGLARPMLELASMLAPNDIPVDVLTSRPSLDYLINHHTTHTAAGRQRKWDAEETRDALQCLRRLSLVVLEPDHFSPQTVRVHSLIQRATREDPENPYDLDLAARAAADALRVCWPESGQHTLKAQALRANTDALVACAEDALWQDGVHPVLLRAGHSLGEAGMVSSAFAYWKQLYDKAIARLGADHCGTKAIWRSFLQATGESGDYDGAIDGFIRLLADRRQSRNDEKHPDVLQAREDLAHWRGEAGHSAYVKISQLPKKQWSQPIVRQESQAAVKQMFQAADDYATLRVDQRRRVGDHHSESLRTLNEEAHWLAEAAHVARHLGVDGAERMQQAIDLYAELLTIKRVEVMATLGELAHWKGENGDAAGALGLYTELLTEQKRVLHEDDPKMLKTRDHLAHWTGENGDAVAALNLYIELRTDHERVLGEEHLETLHIRERIAHWRAKSGDVSTAIDEYTAVLAVQRRVLGNDHDATEWSKGRLEYWSKAADTNG